MKSNDKKDNSPKKGGSANTAIESDSEDEDTISGGDLNSFFSDKDLEINISDDWSKEHSVLGGEDSGALSSRYSDNDWVVIEEYYG